MIRAIPPEELEACHERAGDGRKRGAHLGKRAGHAGQAEHEQLLRSMRQEHRAGDDPEKGKAGVEP